MSWRRTLSERQRKELLLAETYKRDFGHGTAGHNRLELIARLGEILDAGGASVPPSGILDVPYHSQHEDDAQRFRKDCGPDCVEMVGEFYRPDLDATTDDIMSWITGGVDRATYISEVIEAAKHFYDVDLERVGEMSWDDLVDSVAVGDPVIVLVHYGSFRMRMDRNYTGGHFMVVVGFEEVVYQGEMIQRVVVHDPDFYAGIEAQGAFIPIAKSHFMSMWKDCYIDGNPNRVGIRRKS